MSRFAEAKDGKKANKELSSMTMAALSQRYEH